MTTRPATTIRKATTADEAAIWRLLEGEVQVMARQGRDQWQHGYPNPATVSADTAAGTGRVLLLDGTVAGYCALITTGDKCYDSIEGQWLTTSDSACCQYAVVHRLGIDPQLTGRGLASTFLTLVMREAASMGLESMRIDTNHDNVQMLHILPKLGFKRCGTVQLPDGERIAYEKLLWHTPSKEKFR